MSDIEFDDTDADDISQHDPTLTMFRGTRGPHARLGWGRFEGRLGRPVDVDVDGDDRFASDAITSGARDVVRGIRGPPCMHASATVSRFEFEGSTWGRWRSSVDRTELAVAFVRAPAYLRPSELPVVNSSIGGQDLHRSRTR